MLKQGRSQDKEPSGNTGYMVKLETSLVLTEHAASGCPPVYSVKEGHTFCCC